MNDQPANNETNSEKRLGTHPPPNIPDHELLCLIGKGGYGEVWLARNIMGSYRAVKVVYRRTFEHQRPYQREFEGIQRYEPFSRQHPSQVAILHVGRHENDEYYYYVMELADPEDNPAASSGSEALSLNETLSDIGTSKERRTPNAPSPHAPSTRPSTDCERPWPERYSPRTLAADLKRRGKLPLENCVALGIALTTALDYLHQQGLIHRDIKPSNIIFVKGVPKLADIGLIAMEDSTVSFVGTRGYFPPEGPGTARADLYSLGKVLYEISTGKDRNEFPNLPSDLEDLTEEDRLLEFNEILLKACHADASRRYRCASELLDDLLLLQEGKSVRQKRNRERLSSYAQNALIAVFILSAAGLAGFLMAWKPASTVSLESRRLIVNRSPNPFFLVPRGFSVGRQYDYSADGQRIVMAGMKGLSIWNAKTEVNQLLFLPGIAASSPRLTNQWMVPNAHGALPRWAADGERFLFQALKTVGGVPSEPEHVWGLFLVNVDTAEVRAIGPELPADERLIDLCWLPDGEAIVCVDQKLRLYTLPLSGGRSLWLDVNLPAQRSITLGGYSPDGKWLVVSTDTGAPNVQNDQDLWLLPSHGGPGVPLLQGSRAERFPFWHPEEHTVYFVASDGLTASETTKVWAVHPDPETGAPQAEATDFFGKAGQQVFHPRFIAGGKKLIYAVDEPNTRVWVASSDDLGTARELTRGQQAILSPDGASVYFVDEPAQSGIFTIDREGKNPPRKVSEMTPQINKLTGAGIAISADDAFLAMVSSDGEHRGIFLVPTAGGSPRLLQDLPEGELTFPVWSPDSEWLAYVLGQTLYRISRDGLQREALVSLHAWSPGELCWSPDGRHIAALAYGTPEDWEERNGIFIVSVADKTWRKVTPDTEHRLAGLAWHPDGQRVTYHFNGPERLAARIRMAFLDGRPTEELVYQPDHWDYVGVWAPDGRRFFFTSVPCPAGGKPIHIYDLESGQISHALRAGGLPGWCHTGEWMLWTEPGENLTRFEVIENLR